VAREERKNLPTSSLTAPQGQDNHHHDFSTIPELTS
jgi:hypothetical protein